MIANCRCKYDVECVVDLVIVNNIIEYLIFRDNVVKDQCSPKVTRTRSRTLASQSSSMSTGSLAAVPKQADPSSPIVIEDDSVVVTEPVRVYEGPATRKRSPSGHNGICDIDSSVTQNFKKTDEQEMPLECIELASIVIGAGDEAHTAAKPVLHNQTEDKTDVMDAGDR